MLFSACIDIAVGEGRLKPAKGEEAKAAYEQTLRAAKRIMSGRAAEDAAAREAVRVLGKKVAAKQWEKINELRKSADISQAIKGSETPHLEIEFLFDKVDDTTHAIEELANQMIEQNAEAHRSRWIGLWRPIKDQESVIHASYGRPSTPEAAAMAKEHIATNEFLDNMANLEGANLHPDPKRGIALIQTRAKIAAEARRLGAGAPKERRYEIGLARAKEQWVQEHLDTLNWDVIRKDGELIDPDNEQAFLEETFDGIMTSGKIHKKATQSFTMALAQKLSQPDFFYYKDPESWLAMNKKYGASDVYGQLRMRINTRSRQVALLKHLGPHPETMMNLVKNLAEKRAAELDTNSGAVANKLEQSKLSYKVRRELATSQKRYELTMGLVPPGDSALAMGMGSMRNLLRTFTLTAATLSQVGDLAQANQAFYLHNLPATGYARRVMKNLATLPFEQRRRVALRNVGIIENAVEVMFSTAKLNDLLGEGAGWTKRFADSFFKASWMNAVVQAEKVSAREHLLGVFADNAGVEFEALPWRKALEDYGITKKEWDTFRATPIHEPDGVRLIRPRDVMERTDLDHIDAIKLANKFQDWMVHMANQIAPEPNTRIQVKLGNADDPNDLRTQLGARNISFIHSFMTMNVLTYLRNSLTMPPTTAGKAWATTRYLMISTVMGAVITQLKTMLVDGRDPYDMNPLHDGGQFWLRSFLNGGGIPFLGDIIFGVLGQFQHGGIAEILAGAPAQFADQLLTLALKDPVDFLVDAKNKGFAEAFKNEKFARDGTNFLKRWSPVPWQLKLLYNRLFLDDLVKNTNPKGYQTLQRQQAQQTNDHHPSWWGVGQKVPTRVPNFGNAVGVGGKP